MIKDDDIIPVIQLIALKDFLIKQNEYYREIKEGDDLSDIPVRYLQNLKTEHVI